MTLNHSSDAEDNYKMYYDVLQCDVSTDVWFTGTESVYSNKYPVTGLLPGRIHFFWVIVCNDSGDTDPLDSQEQWNISKHRGKHKTRG